MAVKNFSIPKEVSEICATIAAAGFEVYLVGGCVRDILLDKEPKDWDVTTNARPEELLALFPDSVYENTFGTVGVKTDGAAAEARGEKPLGVDRSDDVSHRREIFRPATSGRDQICEDARG